MDGLGELFAFLALGVHPFEHQVERAAELVDTDLAQDAALVLVAPPRVRDLKLLDEPASDDFLLAALNLRGREIAPQRVNLVALNREPAQFLGAFAPGDSDRALSQRVL